MVTKKSAGGPAWGMMKKRMEAKADDASRKSKSVTPARNRGSSGSTVGGRGQRPSRKKKG